MMRKKKQIKPSSGNRKKPYLCKSWSSRNTSTTAISVREATQQYEQYRMFLEYIYENFPTKMTKKPMKEGTLLDLTFTYEEELVRDGDAGGIFGCRDHKILKFSSCSGRCLEELQERWQMVDFKGSHSPGSKNCTSGHAGSRVKVVGCLHG